MARSKTSAAWLNEHVHDHWVHMAQKEGYRSRAAYKLLEIHDKDKLLRPGMTVADLGSAPGSWSQVAAGIVGDSGRVFALDLLEMAAIPGVDFIQGDFREDAVLDQFETLLAGRPLDLVISDMAPNLSGMASIDQARAAYLCELALDFARNHLKPGGAFLVKVFQGSEFNDYLAAMRSGFTQVLSRKPKASRDRSAEIYLLGKGLR
ncbi:RlmE family RNA methyltransferase [Laribacter hongkongensis]|uniref:RlmE family RNA methyltransferase n=1 Tax=Laribacter hongkongensis TaxID=168471 RepID=UPI001EFDADAE|nr:RlmE family RNA methyltransferase [Laribacter hongkongensis]MCG9065258.1 RlmE family RNA methyltransferase [Laribacter hongkongensis]MCG9098394.1 RlmE family RNA methyltransferase [Laribacter hongkongensis]